MVTQKQQLNFRRRWEQEQRDIEADIQTLREQLAGLGFTGMPAILEVKEQINSLEMALVRRACMERVAEDAARRELNMASVAQVEKYRASKTRAMKLLKGHRGRR
jgi:hypothetical protein